MSLRLATSIALVTIWLGTSVLAERAGSIDGISHAAARPGDVVTITGDGFGAFNVRVTVGGVPAVVLAANGHSVTFRVPSGVRSGATTVSATNPGGHSGTIACQIIEGVLLSGALNALATSAEITMPPQSADPADIDDGLILTRLDVLISPAATVGQLNAALELVRGGIVSMRPNGLELTVAIPRQATSEGIEHVIQILKGAPGIAAVIPGRQGSPMILPSGAQAIGDQVFPTRFPAAWNANRLARRDCASRKVTILVPDEFGSTLPPAYNSVPTEVPGFVLSLHAGTSDTHGYDVTMTMAALFNGSAPTGANPFTECLDIRGVNFVGQTALDQIDRLVNAFPPAGRFLVNLSYGYEYSCPVVFDATLNANTCAPNSVLGHVAKAYDRGLLAAVYKARTLSRWNDFLAVTSAGNANDPTTVGGFLATIYPGLADAVASSWMNTAVSDPRFRFVQDHSQWDRHSDDQNLPFLTATSAEFTDLQDKIVNTYHVDTVPGAPNILITGSATAGNTFSALRDSRFSNLPADVMAVGERILTIDGGAMAGTSLSAPQVTGLASYLWLLSDELRNLPDAIARTRSAIEANARLVTGMTAPVIDAYASILSLDESVLPSPATAPVRLAILDANDDTFFTEADLDAFLAHFFDSGGSPVEPLAPDYSRFDLNGDGFTGGARLDAFDLDRVRSFQYGAAFHSNDVTQTIEGIATHFNEHQLTDLEILCYYAYSQLYTGDPTARSERLAGKCGVAVSVTPEAATVPAGSTQQFSATVYGSSDPRVTWTASGGTITQTGLFTAGPLPGSFSVTATSVADSRAHGDGHVTVTLVLPPPLAGLIAITRSLDGAFDQQMSFTMVVTVGSNETLTVTQISGSFGETYSFATGGCGSSTGTLSTQIRSGAFTKSGNTLTFGFTAEGTDTESNVVTGFDENGNETCGTSGPVPITTGFSSIPVTIVRAPDGRITALDFEQHLESGPFNDPPQLMHYNATGLVTVTP